MAKLQRADLRFYDRNPVGRLMLHLYGEQRPVALARSDSICTALQLTNFWQDLERDWRKGRLYVPRESYERHGAREADLTLF